MAMDKTAEANLVIQKLGAIFPQMLDPSFRPQMQQYWEAICEAEITHKIAAMDVLPAAHAGLSLNNPSGQPVLIPTTASVGSPSSGATNAPEVIQGMGSVQ